MPTHPGFRAWWPGQDQPDDAWVDRQLAPRGNATVTPADWAQASIELGHAENPLPEPRLPGLWEHGGSPIWIAQQDRKVWLARAQLIANARRDREILNTSDSVSPGAFRG
jgi:hypothetical protein